MSARRTVDDDDQWVPFLEVCRDHPRRPRGRLVGVFARPVVKAVAILFAVVFFSLSIYLVCVLMDTGRDWLLRQLIRNLIRDMVEAGL
jgi:hypothetical protein